jgi:hypothetical protein
MLVDTKLEIESDTKLLLPEDGSVPTAQHPALVEVVAPTREFAELDNPC